MKQKDTSEWETMVNLTRGSTEKGQKQMRLEHKKTQRETNSKQIGTSAETETNKN